MKKSIFLLISMPFLISCSFQKYFTGSPTCKIFPYSSLCVKEIEDKNITGIDVDTNGDMINDLWIGIQEKDLEIITKIKKHSNKTIIFPEKGLYWSEKYNIYYLKSVWRLE
ncbi:MAG: hypothetical protein QG630_244 [Patescibacteria group bacterium]|nr:hypothetical protein [Patescibacteria group bacterium]